MYEGIEIDAQVEWTRDDIERIVLDVLRGLLRRDVIRLTEESPALIEPTMLEVAIVDRLRELGTYAEF